MANASTLHIAACTPNFQVLEIMNTDVPYRREVTTGRVQFKDGLIAIPSGAGLGIDLNEEAIGQHPYEPRDLRHYKGTLTDIRPLDATSYLDRQ